MRFLKNDIFYSSWPQDSYIRSQYNMALAVLAPN